MGGLPRMDWGFILVEALVSTIVLVVAFEYDNWRSTHETQIRWWERAIVQFACVFIVMTFLYFSLHGRLKVGGQTFRAIPYQSECLGKVCPAEFNAGKSGGAKVAKGKK